FIEHQSPVEVAFQNLTPQAQIAALHDGEIDVGFVCLPLEADGLISERTGRVRLVVGLPEKHPLAARKILRLKELSNEAYILWPRHLSPGCYDRLLGMFQRAGFGPPISMEGGLPSTRTVLGMIAAGLTIALVDPTLSQMAFPGVVFRELAGPKAFSETGVIFRRDDPSPLVAAFLLEVRRASRERSTPDARPAPRSTSA
ncbi:MAG TPA: LysR family substrate-binding domain-containing protein, partial [Thermoanaerobaculia bacterium]